MELNANMKEIMGKFNIDHKNKMLIMPKNIEKSASKYGTDAYNALLALQNEFPTFELKVREVKRSPSRKDSTDGLKGLTFKYMEKYLDKNGNDEQKREYYDLKNPTHNDGLESKATSYNDIRKWFLRTFPQVLDYQKRIDKILGRESESSSVAV